MRYLFTDIDGVLTTPRKAYQFDPGALACLTVILDRTDAKLVLVSSWREETLEKTVRNLPGVLKAAYAQVPVLPGRTHSDEIQSFLESERKKGKTVESYVILDDEKYHYGKEDINWHLVMVKNPAGLSPTDAVLAWQWLENPWTVTDPSCDQRCRIIPTTFRTRMFEYAQDKAFAEIDPEDYIHKAGFAETYLKPFGYGSIEDVKKRYGKDWDQICAECIFETDMSDFIDYD